LEAGEKIVDALVPSNGSTLLLKKYLFQSSANQQRSLDV
jgi:hypothetical protein